MAAVLPQAVVEKEELVQLCAGDTEFYGRTFFPETFRQPSPLFHRDTFDLLDDRAHRYCALKVFRGGAKTTILRVYTSKRIAFGLSRTVLFVSETQDHSKKSLRWIRRQVEQNTKWANTFGLRKGAVWTDEQLQIIHASLGYPITVLALGITGQIRGTNVDDYRPDLIVVDDPCNEENTNTPEQRGKISALFFGALEKSLTPATENPDAKMVLLQTPLNGEDLISLCHDDPQWASREYGCFDIQGMSIWEERFPTKQLLDDKAAHIRRNQTSLWLREMECKVVAAENADFDIQWLQYYDLKPDNLIAVIGIDPVPPPSDKEIASGFQKKDNECLLVAGKDAEDNVFILEYVAHKGHTPEWTVNEFFRLVQKWNPLQVQIETVAYQRTLKWLIEQRMIKIGRYVTINAVTDKRRKRHRILQAYSGIASQGKLFVRPEMSEFREEFAAHPYASHDDVLDAGAMALDLLEEIPVRELLGELESAGEGEVLAEDWRGAP